MMNRDEPGIVVGHGPSHDSAEGQTGGDPIPTLEQALLDIDTAEAAIVAVVTAVAALGLTVKEILFASATSVNSATSITDIVTQAVTVLAGEKVLILGKAKIEESKSADSALVNHYYFLYRDSTQLDSELWQYVTGVGSGAVAYGDASAFLWLETPGAGSYTYKLRGNYDAHSTSGTPTANGRLIVVRLG